MPITPFDDYPVHQTPMPVAHVASGDRNHYDRYFFNGYDVDAGWMFAVAMGVYPNRQVIDAAFSVSHDGVQRSVFASGRAPLDRAVTKVGPIEIEVVEPLRVNRIRVDAQHLGIEADLTWNARTVALEEPRQTMHDGVRVTMDSTRLTQLGTWSGSIDAHARIEVASAYGTKDRSWGIRPVGEPFGGAPDGFTGGGVFFLWAPVNFADECTHFILFEWPDGQRWCESAGSIPVLAPGEQSWGEPHGARKARRVDYELDYRAGARRSRAAALHYDFLDGSRADLEFEPVLDFQMKGIGYFNPDWMHGWWKGERAEGRDEWKTDDLDPLELPNIHVEQLMRVRSGDKTGAGVLEQIVIGPHAPTGLTSFLGTD